MTADQITAAIQRNGDMTLAALWEEELRRREQLDAEMHGLLLAITRFDEHWMNGDER